MVNALATFPGKRDETISDTNILTAFRTVREDRSIRATRETPRNRNTDTASTESDCEI